MLRQAFNSEWVERLRAGIARLRTPGAPPPQGRPAGTASRPAATGPESFIDQVRWRDNPDLEAFVRTSPAAAIAGELMGGRSAHFFDDQLFVKDPGGSAPTPWHKDLSYWPISGKLVCSLWVALDPVSPSNGALYYVRGSHRWPNLYRAVSFAPGVDRHFEAVFSTSEGDAPPDVAGRPQDFDVVTWELEPGDCVVHHPRLLHGAPANNSTIGRRGYATQWLGEDARWDVQRGTMPAPDIGTTGEPLTGPFYPTISARGLSDTGPGVEPA
jgi:ectoine hydroxylase-related dioxygenase (phytanoyl-CoA dioxygenase family)